MKLFLFLILFVLQHSTAFCQTVSSTATGRVNVIQPLSITSLGGALDFGDIILTGSAAKYQITPQLGQQFRITGNPGRSVSITFNQISLSNTIWVGLYGGTIGTLIFIPDIVDTKNNTIISGKFYSLGTSGKVAILDIRVGGLITVSSTQPQGNYMGIFTISVSY